MKGCPYCEQMKQKLKEENLEFIERDIDEHSDEYDIFSEITENEFVPAFMIIKEQEKNTSSKLFAPERDFDTLEEGVEIIKKEVL